MAIEEIREQQVNQALYDLGNLSVRYYNSSGIIRENITSEQFKVFSFDLEQNKLFSNGQGNGIYKSTLSAVLTDFINKVRYDPKWEKVNLDRDSFFNYFDYLGIGNPDVFSIDYDKLRSFINVEDKDNEVLVDVYYILIMIQQSLYTNDQSCYEKLVSDASNLEFRQKLKNAINFYDMQKGKQSLLNEWILVTMKKYYKGSPAGKGFLGKDLILDYLKSGYVYAITSENDLRNRVSKNLKPEDILGIMESSVIYKKSADFNENVDNYINMIMINDIIRCLNVYESTIINSSFEQYMISGDSKCITRFVGSKEKLDGLLVTLDGNTLRKFFSDLGVNNIEEYIEGYCSDKKGPRRG